jgi:hypothetical protein
MSDAPETSGGGGDVVSDLRQAFSGKRGKILLAGGAVVIGYLWWSKSRLAATSSTPADAAAAWDAGAAAGAAGVETPPTTGNTTTAAGNARPTSNEEWLSRAVDYLGPSSYSGLKNALDGRPLTQGEIDLASRAIAYLGTPPEGMPALTLAAPSTGKSNTPPSGGYPAPTGLRKTAVTKTTVSLAWNAVAGAGYYRVYRKGVPGNVGASDKPLITVGGLSAGKSYEFAVAADSTGAAPGPKSSYIKITTAK